MIKHTLFAVTALAASILQTTRAEVNPAGEPMVRLVNPAYRNTLFSTMPDKQVVVALDPKTKTRKAVTVHLKKLGESAILATETLKTPGDTCAIDAAALKPGSYEVVCSAADIAGATVSLLLTILPPNKPGNEVWFDADGICHVNGKPFYPIGLYHLEDHIDPVNEERVAAGKPRITYDEMYQRAKAKGFNTVINFVINETDPDPFIELCERHDMMQIRYVWEGGGKLLGDRVSPYRQHPNMLAWSTMDEPKEPYLFEIGARQYEQIRSDLDPYHPIQIAQCYSDYFAATKNICDLPSPDIYPFQTGDPWWESMSTWQQEWKSTARLVTMFLDQMRTTLGPYRPLWHIVQGSGGERPVRLPSQLEYRNMVYQGICAGARASLVYAYTCPDTDLNGKQYWAEDAPELWQAMGDVNRELHELMPFLLAPGGVHLPNPQASDLRSLLRTVGNKNCLFVVNIGDNPQTLEVDLGKDWKQARVLWETRSVTSREGHLQEQIEPLAVKVYQWESQVIADLRTDYVQPASGDVSNGANNWWYRVSPGGAYDPVSSNNTMSSDGTAFDSGGVGLYNTTPISGLPGDPAGSNNWSNIRYVPVATQEVNITGSIKKQTAGGAGGDGITFYIKNNNTILFTQTIGNLDTATYTFNFNTTLTSGDNLDFLVSPNAANNYWDNFEISATISEVPQSPIGFSIATYAGVTIDGVVGQTYCIQASTDLGNESSWAGVANVTLTQATQIWYDSLSTAQQPRRYYRVVAGPIPIP